MLYIIGGAPRSGKTLLSKRMLAEKHIPYFPLDALIGILTEGAPEMDINHNQPFITKSEKIWKLSKNLFDFFVINEEDYILEGDCILPLQVKEFTDDGNDVKVCFLGYTGLTPIEKLSLLRKYGEGKMDWTNDQADDAMIPILERTIEYSKYLKNESEKYDIKFFDASNDFAKSLDDAYKHLTTDE